MVNEEVYEQLIQQIGSENVNKISSLIGLPIQSTVMILAFILIIVLVWSLIWKWIALWKAAKNNHKFWFTIIFLLTLFPTITFGILEILYIYYFSKIDLKSKKLNGKKKGKK